MPSADTVLIPSDVNIIGCLARLSWEHFTFLFCISFISAKCCCPRIEWGLLEVQVRERLREKTRMRKKYQWKERVSFWWLSPFGLPMDVGHFLACQETEALGLGSWWLTAALTPHELPYDYPTRTHDALWCSMPFRATYLHVPHLKGSLDERMPALPIRYIVHSYKSSRKGDSDLEHILEQTRSLRKEYFVMC